MTEFERTMDPSPNVVDAEVKLDLRGVTLRSFGYQLQPTFGADSYDEWRARPEPAPARADGVALVVWAADLGLKVSLRFERGEFVNIATEGLRLLDAADEVADRGGGGEL